MDSGYFLALKIEVEYLLTSRTIGLARFFGGWVVLALNGGKKLATLYSLPELASVEVVPKFVHADPYDWRRFSHD
jgi:hypothetical protein